MIMSGHCATDREVNGERPAGAPTVLQLVNNLCCDVHLLDPCGRQHNDLQIFHLKSMRFRTSDTGQGDGRQLLPGNRQNRFRWFQAGVDDVILD